MEITTISMWEVPRKVIHIFLNQAHGVHMTTIAFSTVKIAAAMKKVREDFWVPWSYHMV
jgi:4-hydroxyphenylpyruvate dioxygenase-like putative hemolysin